MGGRTSSVRTDVLVVGSTLASFCCEAFSLDRLLTLTRKEIDERYREFQDLTRFESL